MSTTINNIVISVVSHGHENTILRSLGHLVEALDPALFSRITVIVTLNIPEPGIINKIGQIFKSNLYIIENSIPKGFGENHNFAFNFIKEKSSFDWFVVMNPDVYFPVVSGGIWCDLIEDRFDRSIALICPVQTDRDGNIQDFARPLPNPWTIFFRYFFKDRATNNDLITINQNFDWVNGACMIFREKFYSKLSGFDCRYFMYCEDIDICLRLKNIGGVILIHPHSVVHDAQRATRKKISHFYWHITSLLKLWISHSYWLFLFNKRKRSRENN